MKHWTEFSVSAIASVLFKFHDWDFDRAVAAAYWLKNGKIIDHKWGIYASWRLRLKKFPTIPAKEADELLHRYNTKALGRRG